MELFKDSAMQCNDQIFVPVLKESLHGLCYIHRDFDLCVWKNWNKLPYIFSKLKNLPWLPFKTTTRSSDFRISSSILSSTASWTCSRIWNLSSLPKELWISRAMCRRFWRQVATETTRNRSSEGRWRIHSTGSDKVGANLFEDFGLDARSTLVQIRLPTLKRRKVNN